MTTTARGMAHPTLMSSVSKQEHRMAVVIELHVDGSAPSTPCFLQMEGQDDISVQPTRPRGGPAIARIISLSSDMSTRI
jgi:hypothetical protein